MNNTRKNLRFASNALNGQNKIKKKGTSSIYSGVYKDKVGWCARYSNIYIGRFKIETHAAFAYDTFIKNKFNGEGKINNIEKPDNYKEYKKKISSLPRGVSKNNNKFQVHYRDKDNKKNITLGSYDTAEEASKIYEDYKKKEEERIEKIWLSQPILKNLDGIAILPVKYKKEVIFALVDDDLWYNLMKKKWSLNYRGYVHSSNITLHQQVITNTDKDKVIDHIYSKIDNRRSSLRINTRSGNTHHVEPRSDSGMKGVYCSGISFVARLKLKKKNILLRFISYKRNCRTCL